MKGGGEMTTGYKLKFETVRVNSSKKAKKIVSLLREQGRHSFYEPYVTDVMVADYLVFYWTKKGVI